MKVMDSVHGTYEVEQIRISISGEPDVWFRRRIRTDDDGNIIETGGDCEIVSSHSGVEEALTDLEKDYPKIVRVLSRNEDGGLHAIIGPEVCVVLFPQDGTVQFLLGEFEE